MRGRNAYLRLQYSNCDVLKRISKSRWLQTTYGERIVIDLLQPAKVTSRQHKQVLEALEVVQGAIREMDLQPQVGQNATSQLLVDWKP